MSHSITQEWRAFRHDPVGRRFVKHHERMRQHGTRAGAIARVTLGIALIAAGVALLFAPGPGILVLLFGFGLLGGQSQLLARSLDRIETALRRGGARAKRWWRARSMVTQHALILTCVTAIGVACYGTWSWWFG